MKVEINGKTLYHIQAVTDWSDEPYDIFTLADHYPSREEVKKLYIEDRFNGEDTEGNDQEIADFVIYHNVYTVYTTNIEE